MNCAPAERHWCGDAGREHREILFSSYTLSAGPTQPAIGQSRAELLFVIVILLTLQFCIIFWYTFIQDEIRVLPEHSQQGKMLSCTSYDLSQYLCCSSIAFLLYWKFHSVVREEKLQKQLYFCTNSISLSDVSCTRSLILRCASRIGAETIFDSSMELILFYDSVFYCLLYVIVSFIATYVLCSEWNSPLWQHTLSGGGFHFVY